MAQDAGVIANRTRAGVLAYLWDRGSGSFTELAMALELPNNSLSGHLQRLEQAELVELRREFLGRKARTSVIMTAAGRAAWIAHLARLVDDRARASS